MFEHTPSSGGGLFKLAAMLVLVATIGLLSIAARKSLIARKLQAWLNNAQNTRNTVIWLSLALMFILFGGLTIAYELRN